MNTKRRIVVIESGWVFIGVWHSANEVLRIPAHLTEAACIRRWGTTAGLGQLALNGPTDETILDPCGIVIFDNPSAILFTHPVTYDEPPHQTV